MELLKNIKSFRVFFLILIIMLTVYGIGSAQTGYKFDRSWPALQQPWYFDQPNGIAVDEDDYVYVVDTENHQIQKFTASGRLVAKWGRYGAGDGEFQEPYDIVADNKGVVYVADAWNYRIQKFTSDGVFQRSWTHADGGGFVPTGVAVDPLGFVYVVNSLDRCILKFTSDGLFIDQWRCKGPDGGSSDLLSGITTGYDGYIYVSDTENNTIIKYTTGGVYVTEWGGEGGLPGLLDLPSGVAAARNGDLYVSDKNNDRVQKFTSGGDFIHSWGSVGSGNGSFISPAGIAVSKSGVVYVADWNNHRVQVFSPDGDFMAAWESRGSRGGMFDRPEGVAADANGNIYVVDKNNHRIQKFSGDGSFLRAWGEKGNGDLQFNSPFGAAVHGADLFVADTMNHRVQQYTLDGDYVRTWGGFGSDPGLFNRPVGVSADDAYLYVADWYNFRVQRIDRNSGEIAAWGSSAPGDAQFYEPFGIAADGGFVFITDRILNTVRKFDINGNLIASFDGTQNGGEKFNSPNGVLVSGGNIFVADKNNHRIRIFDGAHSPAGGFGEFGAGAGQFRSPVWLCAGGDGGIYVSDGENNRIQSFRPVPADEPEVKALIVAGGGPYPGNTLWDATRMCAGFAWRALNFQGLDSRNIHYMTEDTELDLDYNGVPDPVIPPGKAGLTSFILNSADADLMVLYLTDHGGVDGQGGGRFRLSREETLSAVELNQMLDAMQSASLCRVLVIIDSCRSGAFAPLLQAPPGKERIVITSAQADEDAFFISQGTHSFSNYFWTRIFNGDDLKTAFTGAREALLETTPLQTPLLDGNSDGIDDGPGYTIADGLFIGNGAENAGEGPVIADVPDTIPYVGPETVISATVSDNDGVAAVWCVIHPPDGASSAFDNGSPVAAWPSADLLPVNGDQYQTVFDGFGSPGTYHIRIFARDARGNTSLPAQTRISVSQPLERRAIIVLGAASVESWPVLEENAEPAYRALRFQGYTDDEIHLMSPIQYSDRVDGAASISALQSAVQAAASGNTLDLVLYMAGNGRPDGFLINENELLTPRTLDLWLDQLQMSIPGKTTVVYDAAFGPEFLSMLVPPPEKDRILISTGSYDQQTAYSDTGFSQFFWRNVMDGKRLGMCFLQAKDAVSFIFRDMGDRSPSLDDNGNGIGNEWTDGSTAMYYTIGAGIRLATDNPTLGDSPGQIEITGDQPVTLWTGAVHTTSGVERVWAVISPPSAETSEDGGLPPQSIDLAYHPGTGRFEGAYANFPVSGTYVAAVFAEDADGDISLAEKITIFRTDGKDVYEDDNTAGQANAITVSAAEPQHHNLHNADDTDWLAFYGMAGKVYSFQTSVRGPELVEIVLYDSGINPVDSRITISGAAPDVWDWPCNINGKYYIQVKPFANQAWTESVFYDFRIALPVGVFAGFVKGVVMDATTGLPVSGAAITTSADASGLSRSNGRYLMIQEPGTHTVTIDAAGYQPLTLQLNIGEGGATVSDFKLTPLAPPPADLIPIASIVSPSGDQTVAVGESIVFSGAVTGGDAPFFWFWDFNAGAEPVYSQNPGEIVFNEPGTYAVVLTVTDADGDRNSDTAIITVIPKTPDNEDTHPSAVMISPSSDVTVSAGASIRFEGKAAGGEAPFKFSWDFGGGADNMNIGNPGDVVFAFPGVYAIRFTVTDADGDVSEASITVTVLETADPQPKPQPGRPGVSYPPNNSDSVPLPPEITLTPFTHTETGYAHAQTLWLISTSPDFEFHVINIKSSEFLTELPIPPLALKPGTVYYIQTRFIDNQGNASEWSETSSFKTSPENPDQNQNGVPDDREAGQGEGKCIRTGDDASFVCLEPSTNITAIESLSHQNPETVSDSDQIPDGMIYGLTGFRAVTEHPGDTAEIIFKLSESVPSESAWMGFDLWNGWRNLNDQAQFGSDNRTVTLRITDGGAFDADGTANGVIILFSGPAVPNLKTISVSGPSDGNVGGIGCFIDALFNHRTSKK